MGSDWQRIIKNVVKHKFVKKVIVVVLLLKLLAAVTKTYLCVYCNIRQEMFCETNESTQKVIKQWNKK